MLLKFIPANALENVANYIETNGFLNPHVLDLQANDDLLVVLTDSEVSHTFVELSLKRIWHGPVEVYCATDVMVGA